MVFCIKTSRNGLQLWQKKQDPLLLWSPSRRDHIVVPRVVLAASIWLPLGKRPVPSGTAGKHHWLSSLLPAPMPLSPGAEYWPVLGELNGLSLYPENQKLIMKSCFDIPAGNPRSTTHLIIIHGLIARYTPAHLLSWQSACSPDGTLDSQGQRCQKKRWI